MLPQFNTDSDDSEIFEHFDYADMVDGNAGYIDEFLGFGKKKKAKQQAAALQASTASLSPNATERERTIARLSADGKLSRGDRKVLKQMEKTQRTESRTERKIAKEDAKKAEATAEAATDSGTYAMPPTTPTPPPGQMGDVAGTTTAQAAQSSGGAGGGGGDMPYYPDATNPIPEELSGAAPGETSTPDNPTDLEGVSVVGHPKKDNTILFVIGGIVVLFLLYKFVFKGK